MRRGVRGVNDGGVVRKARRVVAWGERAGGGTGLAPRDVTTEVVEAVLTRRLDGFGELFRMLSFEEIGSAAMLSRATGGIAGETMIFALPGSSKAVELGITRLVAPELGHILGLIR